MNTITQLEKELIPRINNLSVMNQLIQTIYVESNPAQIESIQVNKSESGVSQSIKVTNQVKLKKHKLIIKSMGDITMIISDEVNSQTITGNKLVCECISERLNHDFLDIVKLSKDKEKWSFFNQNIIRRLFSKRSKTDLVNRIFEMGKDSNWVIITKSVYMILKKSNFFSDNTNNSDSIIKNVGQLKLDQLSINVYLDSDSEENVIYFGRYDSVSIILNKNLSVKELKSTHNRRTIAVEVDYEFLVKDSVKCLYL